MDSGHDGSDQVDSDRLVLVKLSQGRLDLLCSGKYIVLHKLYNDQSGKSVVCQSIYLSFYMSVFYLSIGMYVCLSVHSVSMFVCISVSLSVCPSNWSDCLSFPSACLYDVSRIEPL